MNSNRTVNRRKFLGASVSGTLGTGILGWSRPRDSAQESDAKLSKIRQYRTLGRTDFTVSDISAGTGLASSEPSILDALLDAGVNNKALAKNKVLGLPVRVVRGPDPKSSHAPTSGYRYDGLYRVENLVLALFAVDRSPSST